MMQRYSLTRSGVCDCMYKDDNGKWVQFEEATALLAEKDQQLLEENLQVKRLESQLAERDAEIEQWKAEYAKVNQVRNEQDEQLAASQQECERLKEEIHHYEEQGLWIPEREEEARKQAIREALQFIDPITAIHVKLHFGLEG